MASEGVYMIHISDKAADSAEQDQTARRCSLILLYTLRKMYVINLLYDVSRHFNSICHIAEASAPAHAFPGFF